jgi:calnexin
MQNDILFDNIYIGHSEKDAAALAKETFEVKNPIEKAEEEASKPKQDETQDTPKSPLDLKFTDNPALYVREKLDLFITIFKRDPVQAIQFVPEVAGALGVLAVTIIALLLGALGGGAAAAPSKEQVKAKVQKAKNATIDAKNQVVEGVTSSAQAAKSEVQQRSGAAKSS